VKLAIYTDQSYWRGADGTISTARSFVVFLGEMSQRLDQCVVVGPLADSPDPSHYLLPDAIRFVSLPARESSFALPSPRAVLSALRRMWQLADEVDAFWLLGPNMLAPLFAVIARVRGIPFAIGVRQDLPAYIAGRHPGRPLALLAARVLDGVFRLLARRAPAVVVGRGLARRYRQAWRLHELWVSLVREREVAATQARSIAGGRRRVLTVTRLDREKNPLLLVDVLARLGPEWELVICGDGPLEGEMREQLERRGLADRAQLMGHVPAGPALAEIYRGCDMLLHVSLTEGMPQVLVEAFAAGLPAVATDVGGVSDAAGDAAILIPPQDAAAAAEAVARIGSESDLAARLSSAGRERVRAHTLESEARGAVEFLSAAFAEQRGAKWAPQRDAPCSAQTMY
jgi:glycosyltransferase involved in cell wall biosynthesis